MPRLVFPTHSPFFGHDERAVYVALREIYFPAFFEVFGARAWRISERTPSCSVHLRKRRRQVSGRGDSVWGGPSPGRPGAEYPEDGRLGYPWDLSPGPAPAIFPAGGEAPGSEAAAFALLVAEVHAPFLLPPGRATSPLYPPLCIYEMASSHIAARRLLTISKRCDRLLSSAILAKRRLR